MDDEDKRIFIKHCFEIAGEECPRDVEEDGALAARRHIVQIGKDDARISRVIEQLTYLLHWEEAKWEEGKIKVLMRGDSLLVMRWLLGEWCVRNEKYKRRVEAIHNLLEGMVGMGMMVARDGANLYEHIYREGNAYAHGLGRLARQAAEGEIGIWKQVIYSGKQVSSSGSRP